ncbi:MAG: tRNA-intron lyase [Thermoplasmata archaeon]|nr:tRNA-intron lyase [Thermoplasmata archaeon]
MPGRVAGSDVIVDDKSEASQIYNRGWYGTPQSGGTLKLDMTEALYLLETNRLEIFDASKAIDFMKLMRLGNRALPGFEIRYLVYRDLRSRGYIVKGNGGIADFRVFPRGGTPSKSTSRWWVFALSERSLFKLEEILQNLNTSRGLRKDILLAIVDEEGDVTYYEVRTTTPSGKHRSTVSWTAEGLFTGDRVMIFDSEIVKKIHNDHFYGKPLGDKLQLSLIESTYLMGRGKLVLKNARSGRSMSLEQLKKYARKVQRDFDLRLRAYEDLRTKGLIVKTGFKYGSHFRAYEGDPDKMHARFLVHAVPAGYSAIWPEVSRAIRLAHGVRKEILFCKVGEREVDYIKLSRCRP